MIFSEASQSTPFAQVKVLLTLLEARRARVPSAPREVTGSGDAAPTESPHELLPVLSTPPQRRAVLPRLRRNCSARGSRAAGSIPCRAACRAAVPGRAAARKRPGAVGPVGRPAARQAARVGPAARGAGPVDGRPGGGGWAGHRGDVLRPFGRHGGSGLRTRHRAAPGDGRSEPECQLRAGDRAADGGGAAQCRRPPESLTLTLSVRHRRRFRERRGFGHGPPAVGDHARSGWHQHPSGNGCALSADEADNDTGAEAGTDGHLHPVPLLVHLNARAHPERGPGGTRPACPG